MAGRCARSRSRPTARPRSPAASTPRRSAGRCTRNAAEQVLRFHDGAVNAVALLRTAASPPAARTAASRSGQPGAPQPVDGARRPQGAGRRARGLAGRRDARLGVVGPHRRGCGRSPAARRACSKAISRTSTASRSRPTAARWSAPATTRPCASGRSTAAARRSSSRCRRRSMRSRSRPTARSSPPAPTARSIFLSPTGELRGEVEAAPTPIIAVAVSRDGTLVAAAGIRGSVAIIDRATRKLARTLVGPGPAGVVGRRSFPTAARCSPAAPTA